MVVIPRERSLFAVVFPQPYNDSTGSGQNFVAISSGKRVRSTIEYAFKRGVNVLDIPLD